MTMFVSAPDRLRSSIERVIEETPTTSPVCIAVAFWGLGAEELLSPNRHYRIICNLDTGSTNPEAIRKIVNQAGTNVRNKS
jgi:hypothetical protein